ncbi:nucleoside 2-deoxyribosyltransferase domain-containing protein [Cellulophaga sp. E16_2]|uniref:nucleoside 2-deoxyribosyltransferase domain-containing protein n=1 Tax=Cellulophaga sp. E16_2 TaxID=2789297 RepID=UPI001A931DFF|nr:nucleoside 2-deoxyribosyltransferase domain-containing protein [Cellulophaga sp. E16_2]MBO0593552.1 nucleoside 2-deoxyribosyltransferase domain-containing protein [Cellulophaga sp. E16_2]
MVFTSQVGLPIKESDQRYIFLAGSMASNQSVNWRNQVVNSLPNSYQFLDPTNEHHDTLNALQMKKHVEWELDAMAMADIVLLNFLPNALSPISLVELGLYASSKKLYVVCPKAFYKSSYVVTLCERYHTPTFKTLQEAIDTLT